MKVILLFIAAVMVAVSSANAKWDISVSKDEMTDEVSVYTLSEYISPTKKMNFPYGDIKAALGVGCDSKKQWAYVGFNGSTNISSNRLSIDEWAEFRVKWDDTIRRDRFTQGSSSRFLHFSFDSDVITRMKKNTTMLLELPWYEQGKVYFKFSLIGATKAINAAKAKCGQ